jgi:5-methylcytosine-specific restriction endonuclease McrA
VKNMTQSSGRKSVPKPHAGGKWTDARKRSFIMSALRRAQWPVKFAVIATAYVKDGTNPATGKPCKLHKCPECGKLYPKGKMQADHINPVVPVTGFDSWDGVIARMYVEQENYRVLCKSCHAAKTLLENKQRRENKKNQ